MKKYLGLFLVVVLCSAAGYIFAEEKPEYKALNKMLKREIKVSDPKNSGEASEGLRKKYGQEKNKINQNNANLPSNASGASQGPEVTGEIKQNLDTVSTMNEQQQLRLQDLMQKKAQVEATVSNMMNEMNQTQNAIIGNMK